MAAWRNGKQMAIQPPYAKSDKRFTGRQTMYAGCNIAHDRSGNGRGVNVCTQGLKKRNGTESIQGSQALFLFLPLRLAPYYPPLSHYASVGQTG